MFRLVPYAPLNVLKPVADDLWIVDGPVVRMRFGFLRVPFTTRMTVVRLPNRELWVHSPTEPTPELLDAVRALGPVSWLIAPNLLHWTFLAAWQDAFPNVLTLVAPGVGAKVADGGFQIDGVLTDTPPPEWGGVLRQVLVRGGYMTEADFFHVPSATLILTDLFENFEAEHVPGGFFRLLLRLAGAMHPNGGTPRDLQLTFHGHADDVKRAVETMIAWAPRRIVVAHGRCIETDATETLRRALSWALA